MHCGRSIGQVLAIAESGRLVEWPRDTPFAVFRSARPGAKSIRLSGVERFRCSTCGGFGIIEEVEQFATELFNDRVEKPPRRGRRPKPMVWRVDSRLEAFGLADPHGRPTAS